ncbi:dymeclin-like isoform X2 [Gordionus sp. m RMFG-2023]|uniref:dymeclin-like isoform X2 n=1 Tax=Gordionus sp. m RMFG-2023 TaxID=3053472 RepID=UPI0031FDF1C9
MGQKSSIFELENISADQLLCRFISNDKIKLNDIFWKNLFDYSPKNIKNFDLKILEENISGMCRSLSINNLDTGNFVSLMAFFVKKANDYVFMNSTSVSERISAQETLFNILFIIRCCLKYFARCIIEENFVNQIKLNDKIRSEICILFQSGADEKNALFTDDYFILRNFIISLLEIIITPVYSNTHNIENYILILEALNTLITLLSVQLYRSELLTSNHSEPFSSIIYEILYRDPQIAREYAVPLTKALLSYANETNIPSQIKLLATSRNHALEGSLIINLSTKLAGSLYDAVLNTLPSFGFSSTQPNNDNVARTTVLPINPITCLAPPYSFHLSSPDLLAKELPDFSEPIITNGQKLFKLDPGINESKGGKVSTVATKVNKDDLHARAKDESNLVGLLAKRSEILLVVLSTSLMRRRKYASANHQESGGEGDVNNNNGLKHDYLDGDCENPYLKTLSTFGDDADASSNLPLIPFRLNFNSLYQYFCRNFSSRPTTTLFFYLVFHQNFHFKTYVLARSDIESLVIKSPPWFAERSIPQISLGSFMVLILLRTIQNNLFRIRDKYLHTNCLAALSNMSQKFHDLHSYPSQRIVNLYQILLKHYFKLLRRLRESNPDNAVGNHVVESTDLELTWTDARTLQEMLGMILEILYQCLSSPSNLPSNAHLIYNMLYQEKIFKPDIFLSSPDIENLSNSPYFPNNLISLLNSIHSILNVISNRLQISCRPQIDKNEKSDSPISPIFESDKIGEDCNKNIMQLSVEEALLNLKQVLKVLPSQPINRLPNVKFKYVEEEWPEVFFVPYTWSLVCAHSHLYWSLMNVKLFYPKDYYAL